MGNRFGHPFRFLFINWFRFPFADCTVPATTGTNIAKQKERRSAMIPAFANIWTAGFFTNGVQILLAHQA
jgi:hypothetical protein